MAKTEIGVGFQGRQDFLRGATEGILRRNVAEEIVSLPTAKLVAKYLGGSIVSGSIDISPEACEVRECREPVCTEWDCDRGEEEKEGEPEARRKKTAPTSGTSYVEGAGRKELYYKILGRRLP